MSVGVVFDGAFGRRVIRVPCRNSKFLPPSLALIACWIVILSVGYSDGSEPCQTHVQPLFCEINESAVGPVTRTFRSFASGSMFPSFLRSVSVSRAACKLACEYSGLPKLLRTDGFGIGLSKRPSSYLTRNMRLTASSMRVIG